jgi:hypothetical protein
MAVKSYDLDEHGQPIYSRTVDRPADAPALPARFPPLPRAVASAFSLLGSYVTSLLFFWAVGVPGWYGVALAAVVEFILQVCKAEGGALGWGAHGIDTFINGGGIFAYVSNFDNTPTWAMLTTALGLDGELRALPALVLALGVGLILSIAPIKLWRGRRRKKKKAKS